MGLTDEQRAFIASNGKVILSACPGSGKTSIVAEKFLYLLQNWKKGNSGIAILSFTNIACEEIKNKIIEIKGVNPITYPHFIGTVDSFINNYIFLRFGYLLNGIHPKIIFNERDVQYRYQYWRGECYRSCIGKLHEFRLNDDEKVYRKEQAVTCIEHNGVIPCRSYIKALHRKGFFFQSEVPYQSLLLLQKYPYIAQVIKERFPYIIIDEVQDTSLEQMNLFDNLVDNGLDDINLIGDPDQAIYEWRKAKRKCFIDKINDDRWISLSLTNNFRSSQLICNATKYFSETFATKEPTQSLAVDKDYPQKPILLFYDKKTKTPDTIADCFRSYCQQLGIGDTKAAIVSREKIDNATIVKDLWKDFVTENIAFAAYNYQRGDRQLAYTQLEKAVFSLLVKPIDDVAITIEEEINLYIPYFEWKQSIIDLLISLPSVELALAEWQTTTNSIIGSYLSDDKQTLIFPNSTKSYKLSIKQKDSKLPDFKTSKVFSFFEPPIQNNFTISTVHGVKGESFDALLLLVEKDKGTGFTPKFLAEGDLSKEEMRIAYVAMTRPKKFLMVAVPKTNNFNFNRFPDNIWDYKELK